MYNPVSTYRVQFHKDFTFSHFEKIIPYLQRLGVHTVYASPIFEAVPGSTHGYDCVNPHRINPEIGTLEQLKTINNQLKEAGIGWIQDIVPNHMGYHPTNAWLMDVLEKGRLSRFASFFDLTWTSPFYHGRLMAPFLGKPLDEVIDDRELKVAYQDNQFVLVYFDSAYPLNLRSYEIILQACNEQANNAILDVIAQADRLHAITDAGAYSLGFDELKLQLAALQNTIETHAYLESCLGHINDQPECIREIANKQVYRLCFHQETDQHINYRRFFTINGLICLNIQDKAVFDYYHRFVKELVEEGLFQGLRVDHIDGLSDPTLYLENLRELAGDETYIVVEKILEPDEELPTYWPIQGSTGYAYLSIVNNLFTNTKGENSFTRFYQKLLGEKTILREELRDKKAYMLYEHMGGELENLYLLFLELNLLSAEQLASVEPADLKTAIAEFLINCPLYRFYGNRLPLHKRELKAVNTIFGQIRRQNPELNSAVALLEEAIINQPQSGDTDYNHRAIRFYQRCMQFTGPLMAKGMEDTLMYTYNRFIGHDEVGDSPTFFGLTAEEFHDKMIDRQEHWPLALSATSTHDTKRGEDVRSRLNVLTDLTDEWIANVQEWQQLNRDLKTDEDVPDTNDEYFIYQTLVGAYPMPEQDEDDFQGRINEYLEKAFREAKRHSTWNEPNEAYETAAKQFVGKLLEKENPFWKSFAPFQQKVADFGIAISLAQVLLKFTCPGTPDVYQGCEGWDLSLVDPDNRRPVDYQLRQQWLEELDPAPTSESMVDWDTKFKRYGIVTDSRMLSSRQAKVRLSNDVLTFLAHRARQQDAVCYDNTVHNLRTPNPAPQLRDGNGGGVQLWQCRYDARIKLWLVHQLLNERQQQPEVFSFGHYIPLRIKGKYKEHVLAFARRYQQSWYVVAVPLGLAKLCDEQQTSIDTLNWEDTCITLPDEAPNEWINRLQNVRGKTNEGVQIQDIFDGLPVALLHLPYKENKRTAGILMHITSLPSPLGIGDFGPEARVFADFLNRSNQTYWQLLPLNPVESGQGHSPYSSTSSMAGSPLLISPELLAHEGWLDHDELAECHLPSTNVVDFTEVSRLKEALFEKAYQSFCQSQSAHKQRQFRQFCEREAFWLDDCALYVVLKQQHENSPWYEWADDYKLRKPEALKQFAEQNADAIDKAKWLQFVFMDQWQQLRTYCNHRGIKLFGDLPFYISYDSVDVWANPEIFSLDEAGNMKSVAGVPPDYFNANGQLWGMPVFRWDVLKAQGYRWWVQRLRKNMELYDLIRLDHFRAFADYWEVPASEKTAINGQWAPGPGADFFLKLQQELGDLPFVAEDLGDINEAVYELRDAFGLPGMRVVQFAFGDDIAETVNIPHHFVPNAIAYTGTHDNNTSRGWFRKDATDKHCERLQLYVGQKINEKDAHQVLGRMVYASVANTVILPLQDVLGLDETARMNTPAAPTNNWAWRLMPGQLTPAAEQQLRDWTRLYDRR